MWMSTKMLKKIYRELVLIRMELQSIRSAVEPIKVTTRFGENIIFHPESHD